MKFGETIMILVVFFMLLMFGLIIYSNYRSSAIKKEIDEKNRLKSIEVATKVVQFPEMKCSEFMCINCDDAIDLLKLEAISSGCQDYSTGTIGSCLDVHGYTFPPTPSLSTSLSNNMVYYTKLFGSTTINVHLTKIDFAGGAPKLYNYTVYNGKRKEIKESPQSVIAPYFLPINVYDAVNDKCHVGVVEIRSWS